MPVRRAGSGESPKQGSKSSTLLQRRSTLPIEVYYLSMAQLYVTRFSTISLYLTKLYVTQSFAIVPHTVKYAKKFLTVQLLYNFAWRGRSESTLNSPKNIFEIELFRSSQETTKNTTVIGLGVGTKFNKERKNSQILDLKKSMFCTELGRKTLLVLGS